VSVESAIMFARENREWFEEQLAELLRIPSISTLAEHAADCRRTAEWLAASLDRAGIENVEVIATQGHPLVYGDWLHAPGAPTVLLYGHYDVQPVDPIELWLSPPFEPQVRDGFVYARGAVDDKGQVATLVNAVASYINSEGELPVNVRFLLEGEEESGGESIKAFVASRDHRLDADFAQVADSSFLSPEHPSICTGLRGCVYTEVHIRGASHDLHSGEYGGVGPNPLNALAHIIASLRDRDGLVTIPGFFDDVAPIDDELREQWRSLGITEEIVKGETGAIALIGDPKVLPVERMWSGPSLDVHGIPGGFTAPGAKTVIPAVASAKISMRIVPNQKAERTFELFKKAVLAAAPTDVQVSVELIHSGEPVVVPSDTPEVHAALRALSDIWDTEPVIARSGGSVPIVEDFSRELGLGSVLLGYGYPGDNLHAPNERFSLDQFHKGIECNIRFWDHIAADL
jgi:acetylornithine deacetylase/succinyl-diaminopimelate desuccinylase-like protein